MHRYEPFYTKIWSDKLFKEKLQNPLAKLLFIYLFTNESLTTTGIYELDLDACKLKLRIKSGFEQAFKQVLEAKLVKYDPEKSLLWVVNRFRYQSSSPKIIQGAINELKMLNHPFKKEFIERYNDILGPYILQLDGVLSTKQASELLTKENIMSLSKIYSNPESVKKFLYRRGLEVARVDAIVKTVFEELERGLNR